MQKHRPALFTLATAVAYVLHEFSVPLTLGRYSFCSCRKVTQRALSRAPTVLLIISPLCRRIVSKALRKRTFEPLTQSTCKNAFHSLRQYLGCDFIFGYTSRLLSYFRLYCSLANQFMFNLYFTYCSLEY